MGVTKKAARKAAADVEGGVQKPKTGGPGRKPIKKAESYSVYVYRVLKQVHPEIGISKRAMCIMNSFIQDTFDKIYQEAAKLVKYNKK